MAGLQMELAPARATPSPRPKPNIPAKNKSIDELVRLKKELDEMREAKEEAFAARDAMEDDLLNAQDDLEKKEEELRQKSREVEERDEELMRKSREVWTWREKAEKLANNATDERRSSGQGKRSPVPANVGSFASREADVRNERELAEARQQIQGLRNALAEANGKLEAKEWDIAPPDLSQQGSTQDPIRELEYQITQLQDQCRSEQKLRRAAENSLQSTANHYENRLKDMEAQARTQIDSQQRQLQELQAGVQGGFQRMEIDSGSNEELGRLRRSTAEQEMQIHEQRQRAEQFQRMSERLTSQVKQMKMADRGAEQSEQTMRQQVQGTKAPVDMGQVRNNRTMPGTFQRA